MTYNGRNVVTTLVPSLCPAMIMAGALSVTPVRPSVRTLRLSRRRPLSKSNTFDQNFMKLGHIV